MSGENLPAEPAQPERHTLLIRLAGPMQSWGFRSRFDNRDTALEPTRSGITGLLCAALGIGREGDLSRFEALRVGVRADEPGRVMVDYHTAQRLTLGGEVVSTAQSWRYFLAGARFLAGLESADLSLLQVLEAALRDPVWPLFLGRKSFVPSEPVHLPGSGIRPAQPLEAALEAEPWRIVSRRDRPPRQLRLAVEADGPDLGAAIPDVPLDFKARRFGLRYVRSYYVPLPPEQAQLDELHPNAAHVDYFAEVP